MTANIPVLNQIQTIKLVDSINRGGLTNGQWGIYEFDAEWNTVDKFYTQHNYKFPVGTYLIVWCCDSEDYLAVEKNNIPYVKVQHMYIFCLSTND